MIFHGNIACGMAADLHVILSKW